MDPERLNQIGSGRLPGHLGLVIRASGPGTVEAELDVREHHLAPNGFLHAGTVVTLADTACGYGSASNLPDGATGFTTAELKANFVSTVTDGTISCTARLVHGGRTTQVWDASVTAADGRTIALFRCTQVMLYRSDG